MSTLISASSPTSSLLQSDTRDRRPFMVAFFALSFVCFTSGFIGASWQQILAFTIADHISYPDAIESILRSRSSNLPIALVSSLINLGADSILISRIVSGLTLWFCGITFFLTAYALTQRAIHAFWIAIIVLIYPLVYPTRIYDLYLHSGITNAEFGPLVPALGVAMFACKFRRTGFIALGFLPAMHLSLGTWTLFGIIAILGLSREGRLTIRRHSYLLLPGLMTLGALILFNRFTYTSVPPFEFAAHNQYVLLFAADEFCHHFVTPGNIYNKQGFLNLSSLGIFLLLIGCVLAVFGKYSNNIEMRYSTNTYCIFLAISIGSSAVLGLLALQPDTMIGSIALRVMPMRFIGAFTGIAGVILLSVLVRVASQRPSQIILNLLFVSLITLNLLFVSLIMLDLHLLSYGRGGRILMWLMLLAIVVVMPHPLLSPIQRYLNSLIRSTTLRFRPLIDFTVPNWAFIFISVAALFIGTMSVATEKDGAYWNYWKNDAFWGEVNNGDGTVLVAAGMPFAQIITGRQLTLWTEELGGLAYAPQAGPSAATALRDLYEVDLFKGGKVLNCSLQYESEKEAWSNRSYTEWLDLSKRYNFDTIIAPTNWNLKLKIVATTPAHNPNYMKLVNGSNTIAHYKILPN